MSQDLLAQLSEYGTQSREARDPVTPTDVLERAERVHPMRQPDSRRTRGWRVAAAAAVAIVLLVGLPLLLSRTNSEPVATTPEPGPTTAVEPETPTTLVTPSVAVPPTTIASLSTQMFQVWTRVQGPEGATGVEDLGMMTTDGSGFLYCGGSFLATSPNGIDWERTELKRPVELRDSCIAWDGVVVSPGSGGRFGGQGSGDPVVITPSVVTISQPDGDISELRIDGTVSSVAIGGTGILISVVDNRLDPALGLGLTPEEDESVIGTSDDAGILSVHFADGTTRTVDLVEVGLDPEARDMYKTSWWFSLDGVDWTLQPYRSSHELHRVLGTELGFYAIDYGDAHPATVWFTSDGVSWEEIGAVPEGGLLTRSGGNAIVTSPEWLYVLTPSGVTEYALEDLPPGTIPVVGGQDGVLAVQHWNGEELELKLSYAVPGQPFELEDIPPEMEAADSFGMYSPSYAAFGNRYLLLLLDDDLGPTFWIKDFPPN